MDHAFEVCDECYEKFVHSVSILVLMDHAFEEVAGYIKILMKLVSILVLMDHAFEAGIRMPWMRYYGSFNPCFDGSCF